jgi:hypothetical protein
MTQRTATHPHEIEEMEARFGPRLWDATPGVCCAAFQLGACAHTEAFDPENERCGCQLSNCPSCREDALADAMAADYAARQARTVLVAEDDEPF